MCVLHKFHNHILGGSKNSDIGNPIFLEDESELIVIRSYIYVRSCTLVRLSTESAVYTIRSLHGEYSKG